PREPARPALAATVCHRSSKRTARAQQGDSSSGSATTPRGNAPASGAGRVACATAWDRVLAGFAVVSPGPGPRRGGRPRLVLDVRRGAAGRGAVHPPGVVAARRGAVAGLPCPGPVDRAWLVQPHPDGEHRHLSRRGANPGRRSRSPGDEGFAPRAFRTG